MTSPAVKGPSCSDGDHAIYRCQVFPSGELRGTIPATCTRCQPTRQFFASFSQPPAGGTVRDVGAAHHAHALAAQASLA